MRTPCPGTGGSRIGAWCEQAHSDPDTASELDFHPVSIGWGDGAALVVAMIGDLRERYCDVGDGLGLY